MIGIVLKNSHTNVGTKAPLTEKDEARQPHNKEF